MSKPTTSFHLFIYLEATLAGLSTLIPLPIVDKIIEAMFRRRMVKTIAAYRRQPLAPLVIRTVNYEPWSCTGCLWWPVTAVYSFLKSLSRKILYFLTIKSASDNLSYYWHRAFLMDYLIVEGHLQDTQRAAVAKQALDIVLADTTTSPLHQFAQQWLVLLRAEGGMMWRLVRDRNMRAYFADRRTLLEENWNAAASYLRNLAQRYNQTFTQLAAEAGLPPIVATEDADQEIFPHSNAEDEALPEAAPPPVEPHPFPTLPPEDKT